MVASNEPTLSDVLHTVISEQVKEINTEPIPCGDRDIDLLATLLFEARKNLILKNPAVVFSALNVAMDVISKVQQDIRAAIAQSKQAADVGNAQIPTDDMGQG